jgi:hypothetical protein
VGGLVSTYVVNKYPIDGSMGCRFRIQQPESGNWLFLAFQTSFTPVGNALTDISVMYDQCETSSTTVGYALWFSSAPYPKCGIVSLLAASSFAEIILADCTFAEHTIPYGAPLIVNEDGTCFCEGATQATTWGLVKALYR